jgi:N-acetylglucosaminyldiphosphoundecaprenol N-acetyl-beta-D-mannosaminyltransferase
LCAALAGSGKRIYLLGGQPGIADKVAKWIETHTPGLTVCGTRDGYFRPQDEASVVAEIAASQPDLLLVALGVPRQEMFIAEHLGEFNCQVAIGVGGLFDFYSGLRQRAPVWMRKSGLEWLYRLSLEPKRLAKRYLLGNPLFLCRVLKERIWKRRAAVVRSTSSRENAVTPVAEIASRQEPLVAAH